MIDLSSSIQLPVLILGTTENKLISFASDDGYEYIMMFTDPSKANNFINDFKCKHPTAQFYAFNELPSLLAFLTALLKDQKITHVMCNVQSDLSECDNTEVLEKLIDELMDRVGG